MTGKDILSRTRVQNCREILGLSAKREREKGGTSTGTREKSVSSRKGGRNHGRRMDENSD